MRENASPDRGDQALLRSVSIAVDVLDSFEDSEELGVTDVARNLGVAKSTAFRMLVTLEARGLVERTPAGRYRLGMRLFLYGQQVVSRLTLRDLALPILAELRDRVSETVQLGLPMGSEVIYIERLEGTHGLRFHTEYYRRVPGHSSSAGKAMAAHSPPLARTVLGAGLPRWTPRTIAEPAQYERALADIRERGWACSEEELEVGLSSVASPVLVTRGGERHVVAAVSVAGPNQRMLGPRHRAVVQSVVAAARKLSEALEHTAHDEPTRPVRRNEDAG